MSEKGDGRLLFAQRTVDVNTGVRYEPMAFDGCIGYRVEHPDGGVEYVFLAPTGWHEINEDDDAQGDTFVYHVDRKGAAQWGADMVGDQLGISLVDYAEPVVYISHFPKE